MSVAVKDKLVTVEGLGVILGKDASGEDIESTYVKLADYNPEAKTSAMTKVVGKDSSGKLWTEPVEQAEIISATESWLDTHVDPQTGYVVDNSLSISGAAADAAACGELKSALEDSDTIALLHMDEINDTVQSIVFDSVGNVSTITHVRNNVTIREDEFTFGNGTITEVRTLNTGETLTIVTNTNTLQTTITYAAA